MGRWPRWAQGSTSTWVAAGVSGCGEGHGAGSAPRPAAPVGPAPLEGGSPDTVEGCSVTPTLHAAHQHAVSCGLRSATWVALAGLYEFPGTCRERGGFAGTRANHANTTTELPRGMKGPKPPAARHPRPRLTVRRDGPAGPGRLPGRRPPPRPGDPRALSHRSAHSASF